MHLRSAIRDRLLTFKGKWLYRRFKNFTMIREPDFINNISLAARVKNVPGCVVECGVWRGGMSAAIAAFLGPKRKYYLFDSFRGLPPAKPIDGPAALRWQQATHSPSYYDNCSASAEFAQQAMAAVDDVEFELIEGWFEETLPFYRNGESIALLRLDGDWYDSTMVCLENCFQRVSPGGIIIVDDYYTWDGCSRALHDFLSKSCASERIRSWGGVCYLIKEARILGESSETRNN
jgi:O-methyltransferase